ncbi:MAG TPA: hypothetical protein VF278_24980 [Pirellulales bacterium]
MPSMWFETLKCLLRGHHDLCLAAAYGKTLPGGAGKQLHYCARCGRAVWASPPTGARSPPRWADAGQEDVAPRPEK